MTSPLYSFIFRNTNLGCDGTDNPYQAAIALLLLVWAYRFTRLLGAGERAAAAGGAGVLLSRWRGETPGR
jgi:hypothetical protein